MNTEITRLKLSLPEKFERALSYFIGSESKFNKSQFDFLKSIQHYRLHQSLTDAQMKSFISTVDSVMCNEHKFRTSSDKKPRTLEQALDQPVQKELPSQIPFAAFSKVLHKLNRFEVYINKELFFSIFQEKGEIKYIEFDQKHCRKFIPFYFGLSIPDRDKLIRFLQGF